MTKQTQSEVAAEPVKPAIHIVTPQAAAPKPSPTPNPQGRTTLRPALDNLALRL